MSCHQILLEVFVTVSLISCAHMHCTRIWCTHGDYVYTSTMRFFDLMCTDCARIWCTHGNSVVFILAQWGCPHQQRVCIKSTDNSTIPPVILTPVTHLHITQTCQKLGTPLIWRCQPISSNPFLANLISSKKMDTCLKSKNIFHNFFGCFDCPVESQGYQRSGLLTLRSSVGWSI